MLNIEIIPAEPTQPDYQKTPEPGGSKLDIIIGWLINTLFK
jgi:hypothetical protein